jgi:hypothetical protein
MALVLTTQADPGAATWTEGGAVDQITDPGGVTIAIPVTESGAVALVTAGAETRTVAAPTFAGQELLLHAETLVGNCAVTFPVAVNAAGDVTATFSVAGQSLFCKAFISTTAGGLAWRVFFPSLDAVPALT